MKNLSKAAGYVALALVSTQLLVVGVGKAIPLPVFADNMRALHFGVGATRLIGALEVLGVIGLWLPRWRSTATRCLQAILFGAIGAHIGAAQPLQAAFAAAGAIVLLEAAHWLLPNASRTGAASAA